LEKFKSIQEIIYIITANQGSALRKGSCFVVERNLDNCWISFLLLYCIRCDAPHLIINNQSSSKLAKNLILESLELNEDKMFAKLSEKMLENTQE